MVFFVFFSVGGELLTWILSEHTKIINYEFRVIPKWLIRYVFWARLKRAIGPGRLVFTKRQSSISLRNMTSLAKNYSKKISFTQSLHTSYVGSTDSTLSESQSLLSHAKS